MQDDVATETAIVAVIEAEIAHEGPLLPILHRLQHQFGHVPEAALPMIAAAFNIGRAQEHGAMSFYPEFRTQPPAGRVVKICCAEACHAQGGRALAKAAEDRAGTVTVEPINCLGLCANGPAAMVDGRPMAAASREKLAAAVAPCRSSSLSMR